MTQAHSLRPLTGFTGERSRRGYNHGKGALSDLPSRACALSGVLIEIMKVGVTSSPIERGLEKRNTEAPSNKKWRVAQKSLPQVRDCTACMWNCAMH